jgi:DNA-binding transcriptional ArsR family regulator
MVVTVVVVVGVVGVGVVAGARGVAREHTGIEHMQMCSCNYTEPMGHGRDDAPPRLDAAGAQQVATTLQALATPSRVLILSTLRDGPCTVREITEAVAMAQPAVSHQLRLLRNLGLVVGERRGRNVVYQLHDDHVAALIDQALHHAEHLRLGAVDRPRVAASPTLP